MSESYDTVFSLFHSFALSLDIIRIFPNDFPKNLFLSDIITKLYFPAWRLN